MEDGVFRIVFSLNNATTQVTTQVELSEKQMLTLEFCNIPRKREEIQNHLNMSNREHFRKNIISPLLRDGFLGMTIPDKPKSSKQKYEVTKKGLNVLNDR